MKEPSEIRLWLIRTIAEQLNQVLETMAGESPLTESASEAGVPGEGSAFWEISLSSVPGTAIVLAGAKSAWMELGGRVLTAAGLDESDEETISSTFRETLDQAISGMAQAATSQIGREVTATPLKPASGYAPKPDDKWSSVDLVFGDGKTVSLSLLWSDKLIASFLAPPEPPPPPAASASQPMAMAAAAGASMPVGRTADVLFDVELPISVSFGRAHLQLKDVMKLTTGSIVELNRTVSEPVEIIVNNCVIARGEVVVVEGNFGVRINEVISRQERLRTLH